MMSLQSITRVLFIMLLGWGSSRVHAECDVLTAECIEKHVACLTSTPFKLQKLAFYHVTFDDAIIQSCADEIEHQKSFKPLLKTWQTLKSQELDEVILGKFTLLLLLSYHTLFSQAADKNRVTFFAIIPLYYQLSKIPLSKLFDSLEECWTQYQAIMENYGPEKEESFSSWVQNYWWVPLTVSAFTILSFLQWYRAHKKPLSNYMA